MKTMRHLAMVIVVLIVCDYTMGSKEADHQSSSESCELQHNVRCDQLPKETLHTADLFRITSFTFTHTINPVYNCSKAIMIKPISPEVDYSIIFPQGDRVSYYDVNSTDCGKSVSVIECLTGMKLSWHFYKVRLESDTDGYFCPYYCSSDGRSLEQFVCVSVGNSVNTAIKNDVEYLQNNVPGAGAIFDARANCPPPKCTFF